MTEHEHRWELVVEDGDGKVNVCKDCGRREWRAIPGGHESRMPSLTKLMAYEDAVASLAQAKENIKRLKEGAVLSEWDELDKIQDLVTVARCRLRTMEDKERRKMQEAKE